MGLTDRIFSFGSSGIPFLTFGLTARFLSLSGCHSLLFSKRTVFKRAQVKERRKGAQGLIVRPLASS